MPERFVTYMTGRNPTAVYIDGYNLYYGRIRGTPYKWLDVVTLFERLLFEQDPGSELVSVCYFSAPALAKYATHGADSVLAQQDNLRALRQAHPTRFSVMMGKHCHDPGGTSLPRFEEGKPFDRLSRVKVWKLEEKHTDVNLALSMYRAGCTGQFKQLVVCSNDSDIAPALEALRSDFNNLNLGVVMPRRRPFVGERPHRSMSMALLKHASWTRQYLLDSELEAAQLPKVVPTRKKPIRKPGHW